MIFMTREQIRRLDEVAMASYKIEGIVLMENAGRGAAQILLDDLRGTSGSVAVVAGPGNNGGDGFVVARHLLNAGRKTMVFLVGEKDQLQGDAKRNFEILAAMEAPVTYMPTEADVANLGAGLQGQAAVVDALFGTGLDREVRGRYLMAIKAINSSGVPVYSLDLPSGLDANTGRPLGACVKARKTITFACLKRGLVVYPGAELAGEISVVDIGVPQAAIDKTGYDGELMEEEVLRKWVRPRGPDTHKGHFGHILVVAGSRGRTGAALMAALGGLRSGSGLVTIAAQESVADTIDVAKPIESMMEVFDSLVPNTLLRAVEGKDAVVFGPGVGVTEAMKGVLETLLRSCRVPLVIDADGLTLLARDIDQAGRASCPLILTPHPGEMARLTGSSIEEVQGHRIPMARGLAGRIKGTVVLKGARTVIAAADGKVFVNPTGNPGMASGGMGDVLSGMIASFCGQGLDPLVAACLAAFIHGKAGDEAKKGRGEMGLLASDLIEAIPSVLKFMEM